MAKRQEVLLTQDVLKLGNMGDIVKVSPGYARNYLFPYELGIPVGVAHKRQIEVLRVKAGKAEVEREAKANVQKKSLEGMSIQVSARVAHENELFGSIGTKEIVAALAKKGVVVDGKQVHLTDKLKKLGRYKIEVRLHKNVGVEIGLEIVNSDPNAAPLDEVIAAAAPAQAVAAPAAAAADGAAAPAAGPKKVQSKVKNLGKAPEAAAPAPAKPDAKAKK
jgi:large subunit ribosomal protein L9